MAILNLVRTKLSYTSYKHFHIQLLERNVHSGVSFTVCNQFEDGDLYDDHEEGTSDVGGFFWGWPS